MKPLILAVLVISVVSFVTAPLCAEQAALVAGRLATGPRPSTAVVEKNDGRP